MECGTRLDHLQSGTLESLDSTSVSRVNKMNLGVAERRQITILFCDLAESTVLSERLDPEDYRQVILGYHRVAEKVVRRYGGHIAQYLGDGLLIYFGYPHGLEDAPKAAVRAGLGILEAVTHANSQWQAAGKTKIKVRIGIHTGLVVVDNHLALGKTTNIAARLEGLAPIDGLVISSHTLKLVEGWFEAKSIGKHHLKGISEPMEVFQVLRESGARTRLEIAKGKGLSPLVGREKEYQLLQERWKQAKAGHGQLVLLNGEAGIGKSRLADAIKEEIARESNSWLTEIRCSPHHQNSALFPFIELLENIMLQYEREDSIENKMIKLEGFLLQSGLDLKITMPLFAEFLSIPSEKYPPPALSPTAKKLRIIESLIQVLVHRAAIQPILLVIEDLHWADASILEWLDKFLKHLPTLRIFTLCTTRPGFLRDWVGSSQVTLLTLQNLMPERIKDICRYQTKGKALPKEILEQIYVKTGGVPLFVEELTKMILESDLLVEREKQYELVGPLPPLAIPSTLQDSLLARLDRMSSVKNIIQLGSVLGREFSFELLNAVLNGAEDELQGALSQLMEAELLYQLERGKQTVYRFKHALIRDVAYDSILKSSRQRLHRRVAEVLEDRFAEVIISQPELLAYHYTQADLIKEAIPYWQSAGKRAIERSAYVEAVNHLKKGLELLRRLPPSSDCLERELALLITLGPALMSTRGFASPEVGETYKRAQELCSMLKETPEFFSILWGLWYYYMSLPQKRIARELAERLLALGKKNQDNTLKMIAHRALGAVLVGQGEFTAALAQIQQGIAYYDPESHRSLAFEYGQDIGVICKQWFALALWLLGRPDQARKMGLEAIRMAREVAHPTTLAYVLYFTAKIYHLCGEGERATFLSEECIKLSALHDISLFYAAGSIMHGREMVEMGQIETGFIQLHENLTAYRATGAALLVPYYQALLAEVYKKLGRTEEALLAVNDGLFIAEKGGEHAWDAELYRLKGELLRFNDSDESEAELCFEKALGIARLQQAKSWELRAAISLCRLWQKQKKIRQAQNLLQSVYDCFSEGFDSADLKEAKVLLSGLETDISTKA